jgi:hypothetical protein
MGGDFVTKDMTAIAWAWADQPEYVTCHLLQAPLDTMREQSIAMLSAFVEAYNQADMVTGHYILGFDLPLINGMLMERHLPTLTSKKVHDTKIHLVKRSGISGSQENLAAMLELEHDKIQMNQAKWRSANRLEPSGIEETRKRVVGDVKQHMEMRLKLLELGYLTSPKMWTGTDPVEGYTP